MPIVSSVKDIVSIKALIELVKMYSQKDLGPIRSILVSGGPELFLCIVNGSQVKIKGKHLGQELSDWLHKYAGIAPDVEIRTCDIHVPYESIVTATVELFVRADEI